MSDVREDFKESSRQLFQAYSAATSDEEAGKLFELRFGRRPARLIRTGGGVLLGPVDRRRDADEDDQRGEWGDESG
jgi:hypothetical protein